MGLIDGKNIEFGSMPLDRLAQDVASLSQINSHVADNVNPHGARLYQSELVIGGNILLKSDSDTLYLRNETDTEDLSLYLKNITLSQDGAINQITVNELALEDAFINLNKDFTGDPTEDMGLKLNRGNEAFVRLYWDEAANLWMIDTQASDGDPIETYAIRHSGDTYSKTESDARFVNITGDTMIGELRVTRDDGESRALYMESSGAGVHLEFKDSSTGDVRTKIGSESSYALLQGASGNKIRGFTRVENVAKTRAFEIQMGDTGNAILKTRTYADGLPITMEVPQHTIFQNGIDVYNNKIINVANPDAAFDALNLGYADSRFLALAGGLMTGNLSLEPGFINLRVNNPDQDGGLYVARTSDNAINFWDETIQRWVCGTINSNSPIVTEDDLNNATNINTIQDIVGGMVSDNTELGINVTYDGDKLNFNLDNFIVALTGDVTGSATCVNAGDVSIEVTVGNDTHEHTKATLPNFDTDVKSLLEAAFTGNAEAGITAVYNNGKIDLDVSDSVIALTGDVSGTGTLTNLGNLSIPVTVQNNSHWHDNLTGTVSGHYTINQSSSGVRLEAASQALTLRNVADTEYADLHVRNIYQHGTVFNVYAETMTVADNIFLLNSNVTGTPTENAGIEVERGTSTNAQLIWHEASDAFACGLLGDIYEIVRYDAKNDEYIRDMIGAMATSGSQSGISVAHDDANNRLNFAIPGTTLALSGDATGSISFIPGQAVTMSVNIPDGVVNAGTVGGINPDNFVRSDVSDQKYGALSMMNNAWMHFYGTGDKVIYFRRDGSTAEGYVGRINSSTTDYMTLYNSISGNALALFDNGAITYAGHKVWHAGNDGAGSGLDADTVDGLNVCTTTVNNQANVLVRTDSSGYIYTGWINTTSGDQGAATIGRVYTSNTSDSFLRYHTPLNFANQILTLGSAKNAHSHTGNQIGTEISNAAHDIGTAQTLRWKRYGNNHVIFDASNSTSPAGTSVSNADPYHSWAAGYPTLMGWDGNNTFGVRVDRAKYADSTGSANYANNSGTVGGLKMARYSSTFASATGNRVVYHSGFSGTNYNAHVTPTSATSAQLGDVYVIKYSGYVRVYNTGTHTGSFDLTIIGS